jgi:tRNA 2-selenouridine synthase
MNVALHCWRGGMRSGAMAWALNLYGFNVHLVSGGYKAYRRWCRQQFEKKFQLMIIGGMTGSGKTRLLADLDKEGEQTIDLEDIACHQGSVYGSMNRLVQPTQEQFENNLGFNLSRLDPGRRLWLEDESINIGCCQIPTGFWKQMQGGTVFELQVSAEERVKSLVQEYGCLDKGFLIEKTERIRKRLGPEQTRDAIAAITEDRMEDFIRIVLVYYDKTYRAGLRKREIQQLITVPDRKVTTLLQTAAGLQNRYQAAL